MWLGRLFDQPRFLFMIFHNPVNLKIADNLLEIASLLEAQNANPFRVKAYREAARTVADLEISVSEIVAQHGFDGLVALPHIGSGIARSIYEYVAHERMTRLEALRGGSDPEALLRTVPGIGEKLAARLHHELHIDNLEALEMAIHNGRLAKMPGLGERRIAAISAALTQILGSRKQRTLHRTVEEPPIELILEVDKSYLQQVKQHKLPKIAPKRFNPENKAWLPVLHTSRHQWHFTALFSNTARAHQLHKTNDWVIIYFYDEHQQEGQHTVVTETHGSLEGKRVVRGREMECREYYAM